MASALGRAGQPHLISLEIGNREEGGWESLFYFRLVTFNKKMLFSIVALFMCIIQNFSSEVPYHCTLKRIISISILEWF